MIANVEIECYFLDVGQGSSQIVLLPDGGAIVIDGGDESGGMIPLQLLDDHLEGNIEALVVTHNHKDHSRGACAILEQYAEIVMRLFFPKDAPVDDLVIYQEAKRLVEEKRFSMDRIGRLETDDFEKRIIYPSRNQLEKGYSGAILEVLAPGYLDELESDEGAESQKPNRMAGILAVCLGSRRLLFSSDATVVSLRHVVKRLGGAIVCDVASLPHHGGNLSPNRTKLAEDQKWLHENAMHPDHVVISAGTDNSYEHPLEEAVCAARRSGANIMCTQITPRCYDPVEEVRPGMIPLQLPCRSTPNEDKSAGSGKSRNVACASTILVEVSRDEVDVHRSTELQTAIDERFAGYGEPPLCRRA